MRSDGQVMEASCACGAVVFRVAGPPILRAVCYCASCRSAGREFAASRDGMSVVAADGGTDFVLYRKDRVALVAGGDQLREHRLKADSPTRRVVAVCCGAPMVLDFTKGHWLSFYRDRLAGEVPPVQERAMTSDLPPDVKLGDDIPNSRRQSGKFIWKLLASWAAMGFRRPKLTW